MFWQYCITSFQYDKSNFNNRINCDIAVHVNVNIWFSKIKHHIVYLNKVEKKIKNKIRDKLIIDLIILNT